MCVSFLFDKTLTGTYSDGQAVQVHVQKLLTLWTKLTSVHLINETIILMRFDVLRSMSFKMAVSWLLFHAVCSTGGTDDLEALAVSIIRVISLQNYHLNPWHHTAKSN